MNAEDLKNWLVKKVIESMPEEIKAKGGCTDPKGIEVAVECSTGIAEKIAMQLMLLLISMPDHNHEVLMKFPSLNKALEEKGLPPFKSDKAAPSVAKGESIKDTPNAPAPTQAAAKA